MNKLKDLITLISNPRIRYTIPGDPVSTTGKMSSLYHGIKNGDFKTDEEAAFALYKETANHASYKKLKYRLQIRLVDAIFKIDFSSAIFNDQKKAFYSCNKAVAAVEILLGQVIRGPAIDLAEKTLRISMDYEFTSISLSLLRRLRRHYGANIGDMKKFKKYNDLTKNYAKLFQAELIAEEYYEALIAPIAKSKALQPELIELASSYTNHLEELKKELDSYQLNLYYYLLSVSAFEVKYDLDNMIRVCQEAVYYFSKKKHASNVVVFTFLIRMFNGYLDQGKYVEGEKVAQRCLKILPEGVINWFLMLEWYFLLCIRKENYQQAMDIYMKAAAHKNFKNLYSRAKETWIIYDAFLNYFVSINKLEVTDDYKDKFSKFRLTKFLNELPNYAKDKRGVNITILIIQVLFLLQQKKFDMVIDKVEALKVYCYRYLRRDDTFRSNCFIKMLLLLPKSNFHQKAVIRKAEPYLEKLRSASISFSTSSSEIEIVPYELLWRYVINNLDNKFFKPN